MSAFFPAIRAHYDDEGVVVYQAFKDSIVEAALAAGTFAGGFNRERMTWIKPSFGWMLYRSGYASKRRQTRVLKIWLSHEGFLTILRQGVSTALDPDIFESEEDWRHALSRSEVRYQWDPERALDGNKTGERAIQLGIRGETVAHYVDSWILGLEDVTELAKACGEAARNPKRRFPETPLERIYPVDEELAQRLGMKPL